MLLLYRADAWPDQFIVGSSTTSLRSLRKTLNMPRPLKFDMVFLDHLKPLYTIDLKVMEEEGLVGPVSSLSFYLISSLHHTPSSALGNVKLIPLST